MIISVSRRGDIPAFGADWFMEKLRAGEVAVPNPFRPGRERQVCLSREAVDALVFWSREPQPLLRHLAEIERRGYPFYFLITLTGYPRFLEPAAPAAAEALRSLGELTRRIGRRRLVWRYDPVIFTPVTNLRFHADNFSRLAELLAPVASRVIVSFFDPYPKVVRRLRRTGIDPSAAAGSPEQQLELLERFAAAALRSGLEIQSCAEPALGATAPPGANARPLVGPGKCVDEELLNEVFGLKLAYRKDPSQRRLCLCQQSVDIGSYGTCRHGCLYCYAC